MNVFKKIILLSLIYSLLNGCSDSSDSTDGSSSTPTEPLISCGVNKKQICATSFADDDEEYDFNGKTYLVVTQASFDDVKNDSTVSDDDKKAFYERIVTTRVTDMSGALGECIVCPDPTNNQGVDANVSHWDTSSVTKMNLMFAKNAVFKNSIVEWDVSSVKSMQSMFFYSKFNPNIAQWDVSSVEYMSFMFQHNLDFNPTTLPWDVSSVIDMEGMFAQANHFNADISQWDVSSVTNMGHMFYQATVFDKDISRWSVSQVTDKTDFCDKSGIDDEYNNSAPSSPKSPFGTCQP